ncbi:MAG TPA: hypothetical protein PLZ67_03575 [Bacteroidales bacterium]|nr:hypothetical protein [Bacteroidales bacterium]
MKTNLILVVVFMIALPGFVLGQLPSFPAKSKVAVVKFLDDLSAQQLSLNEQISKFNKENDAVGEQIDPSKMTAAYGMTQDVNALMERQQRSLDNQEMNEKLAQRTMEYESQWKKLVDSLSAEMAVFNVLYTEWADNCLGIPSSNCNACEAKKNQKGDEILMRYFFGSNAILIGWLNTYVGDVPVHSKQVMIEAMSIQEETLGFKFPHSADLAALEEQKAIIDAILKVFEEIDLKLFPGAN